MVKPKRFDVHLVSLDPTIGAEIQKTRPCIVVSPDESNKRLNTVVVVPITSAIRSYPSRVNLNFRGREGQAAIDQIRSVDDSRLIRRVGKVDDATAEHLMETLGEYFSFAG